MRRAAVAGRATRARRVMESAPGGGQRRVRPGFDGQGWLSGLHFKQFFEPYAGRERLRQLVSPFFSSTDIS